MAECSVCGKAFARVDSLQAVCGLRCAKQVPRLAKKAERATDAKRREALKTRSEWMKEAQTAFNAFIRARDADKPCICCGASGLHFGWVVGGVWDAGHYRSVGSAPHLRFDERNVHRQLKQCNRYGSGRAVDYRRGLIKRIGLAAVEQLEQDQTPRKYTVDELRAIKATYRAKARQLLMEMENDGS